MLENVNVSLRQETVYRLVSTQPDESLMDLLKRRGTDPKHIDVAIEILSRLEVQLTAEELVNKSFSPKHDELTPFPVGRFSDGTFGAFYSALEIDTCKKEVEYHLTAELKESGSERIANNRFYDLIKCNYSGNTASLCGFEDSHPQLISKDKSGYSFCQNIAREAKQRDLDGLLTPSARKANGVCVPVFSRYALFEPSQESHFTARLTKGIAKILDE